MDLNDNPQALPDELLHLPFRQDSRANIVRGLPPPIEGICLGSGIPGAATVRSHRTREDQAGNAALGSGFAIMSGNNFQDWRTAVWGRKKWEKILDSFKDQPGPEVMKYACAPCSNRKGAMRDLMDVHEANEKCGIIYGGLVELIVNAMVDIKEPMIIWDEF